ncbi:MAG: hypothetical protein GC185_10120 [Alphaproteobacteria bacterium]|nr:hypothetical protein [Alphaproteobacteria bacterium]
MIPGIFNKKSAKPANDNEQQSLDQQLLAAAEFGELEKLKDLIAKGADINARSPSGDTPLILAAREDKGDIVAELLAQKADAALQNNFDQTAVHIAIREATVQGQLKALIAAAGKDGCDKQDMHRSTAAFYAAQTANLPALEMLAAIGADMALPGKNGTSPLLWATQLSHNDAALFLMDAGVPLDGADDRGMTGMMHAANLGNKKLVDAYIERGASAELRAKDGRRAQDFAHARYETAIADAIDDAVAARYASIHKGAGADIVPMKRLKLRPKSGMKS